VFGGINLEDIAAPRCFEVEERLRAELDVPVFHDDQHGTAVVVLAALINALKIVGKSFENIKVVVVGAGAAGTAVSKILLGQGVPNLVVCDRSGALCCRHLQSLSPMQQWLAQHTNPAQTEGTLLEAVAGADVFIGLSGPNALTAAEIRTMARDPIVFALANPVPEIMPEEAAPYVRVMATGRSDYPNQINNVLCFPGLFRGVLDSRAHEINEEMKVAAAQAIAQMVRPGDVSEDYIIPSVFNKKVACAVAHAVARAAVRSGVARREREH
jgi:malate dehydrogenase (oxaloacetate-decarboxylating)